MEVFSVDANTAKKLTYRKIPAWDSVGHMSLIAKIAEMFNVAMDPDDMLDFLSFDAGRSILSAKYGICFD